MSSKAHRMTGLDVHAQAILTDVYLKEATARIGWFKNWKRDYPQRLIGDVQEPSGQSRRYQVLKPKIDAAVPFPSPGVFNRVCNRVPANYRRRAINLLPKIEIETRKMYDKILKDDPNVLTLMHPVSSVQRTMIREDCGPKEYLKARNGDWFDPCDKYLTPMTSYFTYGWCSRQFMTIEDILMDQSPYSRKAPSKDL